MQSNNTSASVKALFRYRQASGTTASSSRTPRELSILTSTDSEAVEDPIDMAPPLEELLAIERKDDPHTSNTINSILNFREIFKLKRSIMYCFCVALSGFVFGLDIGLIGGLVNFPSFQLKFGDDNGSFNRITLGIIIGACSISSCFSGLASNYLTNEYGRKTAIITAMTLYVIGLIVFVSSQSWYQIVVGRVLNGIGVGISSVAAPMLISELPQPKLRGSLVSSMQLMTTFGIFTGSLVLFCTKNYQGDLQYQAPVYFAIACTFITIIAVFFVPESPIFLVQMELHENAAEIIADINNLDRDHWYVAHWVSNLIKNLEKRKAQDLNYKNKIRNGEPKMMYRAMIGIIIMALQQLTGINYFFFYGTSIFQNAGIDNPYITTTILASVNLITSMVSIVIADRYDRRIMLIMGSVVMFCCMTLFASVGSFAPVNNVSAGILITSTCIFIAAFSITWGPIAFMVVSELFPYKYKAKGMALASSANWIATFLISFGTPFITELIGFKYGYFFALFLLISLIFVWGFVPETRKRESDQIDAIFSDGCKTFWKGTKQYDKKTSSPAALEDEDDDCLPTIVPIKEAAIPEDAEKEQEECYEMVDMGVYDDNPFL